MSARPFVLAGKDLKTYFRDSQSLFFGLALPLVLTGLMVASFGGQTQFNAKAYVVNLDEGPAGAELARRLKAVPELTVELLDQSTAERRLADSDIVNVLVIGDDFSSRLEAGLAPDLGVRQRGTGGTEGQIANSYAAGLARTIAGEYLVARQAGAVLASAGQPVSQALVEAKVAELFAEVRGDPPVTVAEKTVGVRADPVTIYLPGLVTMFTLFAISLTSTTLVEERRKGTFERLMTTRLTRGELLTGFWLGALGRGFTQLVVLFGLAWIAFRIFTPASFLTIMTFGVVAVASVSGIGLAIAALSRTAEQANWVAVFFTMIMTTLGGSFFDLSGAKGILAVLSRWTDNFWANDGLRRIMIKGEAITSPALVKDMIVLVAIGLASWAVALAFFRLRGDER